MCLIIYSYLFICTDTRYSQTITNKQTMADSSLDEIIKQKRSVSRGASRGGRGARRGARGVGRAGKGGGRPRSYGGSTFSGRYSSALSRKGAGTGFKASRRGGTQTAGGGRGRGLLQRSNSIQLGGPMGTSIIVSNLDFGVNDADINELFSEFGRLRRYGVHYNAQGSSIGTAEVVFTRSSDAMKAIQAYQDVPLDGRPMRLHVAMSSFRITQLPGESPAPPRGGGSVGGGGGGGRGTPRRGGRSRRGGRGARGRGSGMGRKIPSANELNDDLDKYHKTKSDSRTDTMDQS